MLADRWAYNVAIFIRSMHFSQNIEIEDCPPIPATSQNSGNYLVKCKRLTWVSFTTQLLRCSKISFHRRRAVQICKAGFTILNIICYLLKNSRLWWCRKLSETTQCQTMFWPSDKGGLLPNCLVHGIFAVLYTVYEPVNTSIALSKKSLIRCKTVSTGRKAVLFPKGEHFAGRTFDELWAKSVDTSDPENSNSLTVYSWLCTQDRGL